MAGGIVLIQIGKYWPLQGLGVDQVFQITEKADPVTAFGCGVVKVDVGGDVAEQVVADGFWVVFQVLGEMGGVLASLRSQKLRFHGRWRRPVCNRQCCGRARGCRNLASRVLGNAAGRR